MATQISSPGFSPAIEIANFVFSPVNLNQTAKTVPQILAPPEALLGPLSNFVDTFAGRGLNLIFRPNSGSPTTTTFPNPVQPAPPNPPSENVLEINLTNETLSFSKPLGRVPNRGLENQNDIFLNGVPYVQAINDVTNIKTGKGDGAPTGIHFETGLWMNVPATTNSPVLGDSLVRMASIPHGTTINAQCLEPTSNTTGPPTIPAVDITPFPIGASSARIRFASQTAANADTPRLPQDLTAFIDQGTVTQVILNDPNTVLRNAIHNQTILSTTTFTVATNPPAPEFGGGTTNIAFLQGNPAGTNPNAEAIQMTATFWIEIVQFEIVVPMFKHGSPPLRIQGNDPNSPTFLVAPPSDIKTPKKIKVTSTQIQYSQMVILNFGGLSWPHVSVATLFPSTAQTVPASAFN